MQEPGLGKAMTALEFLSQNAEARRLYEMRQKALHDEASLREGAREEGEKLGELKGELKGKREIAAKMLAKGMDMGSVAEFTGLPWRN